MARTVGATASRTSSVLEWLAEQLEKHPTIPNSILREGLTTKFGLGRARSFELISKARKASKLQDTPSQLLGIELEKMWRKSREFRQAGNTAEAVKLYIAILAALVEVP